MVVDESGTPVDPLEELRRRAASALGADADRYLNTAQDSQPLPRGSHLRFVPEADGIDPPPVTFPGTAHPDNPKPVTIAIASS